MFRHRQVSTDCNHRSRRSQRLGWDQFWKKSCRTPIKLRFNFGTITNLNSNVSFYVAKHSYLYFPLESCCMPTAPLWSFRKAYLRSERDSSSSPLHKEQKSGDTNSRSIPALCQLSIIQQTYTRSYVLDYHKAVCPALPLPSSSTTKQMLLLRFSVILAAVIICFFFLVGLATLWSSSFATKPDELWLGPNLQSSHVAISICCRDSAQLRSSNFKPPSLCQDWMLKSIGNLMILCMHSFMISIAEATETIGQ